MNPEQLIQVFQTKVARSKKLDKTAEKIGFLHR